MKSGVFHFICMYFAVQYGLTSLTVREFDYVEGYDYGFEDKAMYSVQHSNIRFKWSSNISAMATGVPVITIVLPL